MATQTKVKRPSHWTWKVQWQPPDRCKEAYDDVLLEMWCQALFKGVFWKLPLKKNNLEWSHQINVVHLMKSWLCLQCISYINLWTVILL
jgi:hypothetical protein